LGAAHAAQVEATVRACGDRLSRYIYVQRGAYGDGLNHKESDPLAPTLTPRPTLATSQPKPAIPDAPADACRGYVSVRRSSTGRAIRSTEQFFGPLRRRPIIIPDGYRLMQFVYVHDLVEAIIRAW